MPPPLLNIGYGNFVASDKIIAVVEPDSAPIKRVLAEYRQRGMLIDATAGHKTRAVLAMDSGHLILSANKPDTLAHKINGASTMDPIMKGLLVVVSGPSGAGKTSALARLTAEMPMCKFSVSMTTRPPREKEIEGKHYYFVSDEKFLEMQALNQFLEHARVHGHYYGTPGPPVLKDLDSGFDIILDIDVQGAAQVRHSIPDAVFLFLAPPSLEELRKRLEKRGTESATSLEMRMEGARKEMEKMGEYQYLVVNQDLEEAAMKLKAILIAEKCRTHRNTEFLALQKPSHRSEVSHV